MFDGFALELQRQLALAVQLRGVAEEIGVTLTLREGIHYLAIALHSTLDVDLTLNRVVDHINVLDEPKAAPTGA